MFAKLSFLIPMLCLPFFVSGQTQINCGGISQVIPHFTKGDNEILTDQPLINKKILEPITLSASAFEIRMLYFVNIYQITVVISCTDSSVKVTSYGTHIIPKSMISKEILSNYIDGGSYTYQNDTTLRFFYNKETTLKPVSNLSWNEILSGLVKNHFFDLPSQAALDKIALKYNPKASKPMDAGFEWFEIKAGDQYRYYKMGEDYEGIPAIAKYVQYKQNIINLLSFH